MKHFSINRKVLAIMFIANIFWLAMIISAPFFSGLHSPWNAIGKGLYFFYQPICHQMESRSIFLSAFPFAVCIRCFAVYCGTAITAGFYLVARHPRKIPFHFYVISLLPSFIDFVLEKTNFYPDSPILWIATGLLLGITLMRMLLQSLFTDFV